MSHVVVSSEEAERIRHRGPVEKPRPTRAGELRRTYTNVVFFIYLDNIVVTMRRSGCPGPGGRQKSATCWRR